MRNALYITTALTGFATGDTGTEITTPLGRVVWGHPLKPRHKTDNQNNKLFNDDGSPVMEVAFGLAIPQDQFAASVWPAMAAEIAKGYPNGAPGNFSYKMTQPHEIDNKGKPYSEREGYAGHVVLAVATTLQPPAGFKFQNGAYMQIGADDIKCGDWVMVGLNFKVNVPANRSHTPSIYVNPLTVLLCYEGDAIAGSGFQADPNQMFGQAPQIAPPPPGARAIGASAPMQQAPAGTMPGMGNGFAGAAPGMSQPMMGSAGTVAPAANGMPMQGGPAQGGMPGMQQPQMGSPGVGTPMQQPGQMPPPATDFIPGAPQQPQGMGMPGQAAAAPGGMPGMPQR